MGRRISERRMTEPNQRSVAIGVQRELYPRLPWPEAFDPTPGEDNLPIQNKLNIDALNPETVEISKAKHAADARIGHHIAGQPSHHSPGAGQKCKHRRWRRLNSYFLPHVTARLRFARNRNIGTTAVCRNEIIGMVSTCNRSWTRFCLCHVVATMAENY